MELNLVRHLWGIPEPLSEKTFAGIRMKGYQGIEVFVKKFADVDADNVKLFKSLADQHDLFIVLQIITSGKSVDENLLSLEKQLEHCRVLNPRLVNIHSGQDFFDQEEINRYFNEVSMIENDYAIPFAHETHRGTILFNPWSTRRVIEAFPDIKLTCDFSHWVCVCERLIDDQMDIIDMASRRCYHLHARVGYECGPQVSDPRAPEFARHLNSHEIWWDLIWRAQRERGDEVSLLVPEFGPRPYLQELPYTMCSTVDLEEICDWQAARQLKRFNKFFR